MRTANLSNRSIVHDRCTQVHPQPAPDGNCRTGSVQDQLSECRLSLRQRTPFRGAKGDIRSSADAYDGKGEKGIHSSEERRGVGALQHSDPEKPSWDTSRLAVTFSTFHNTTCTMMGGFAPVGVNWPVECEFGRIAMRNRTPIFARRSVVYGAFILFMTGHVLIAMFIAPTTAPYVSIFWSVLFVLAGTIAYWLSKTSTKGNKSN